MNYIGSKNKLSSWIVEVVQNTVKSPLQELSFCDLFAGTGIVGRTFKPLVKQVMANDVEFYSFVLLKNYIETNKISRSIYLKEIRNSIKQDKFEAFVDKCRDTWDNSEYPHIEK
mgnify:CR=1 FL=1